MARPARRQYCPEQVLGWIPWYADGDLTDEQKAAVDAHASKCSRCRAELALVAGEAFEIGGDLPNPNRIFAAVAARIADADRDGSNGDEPGR